MKKVTHYTETNGTSFYGQTIVTTPNKLIALAKQIKSEYSDCNDGVDKVNFEFGFKTDDGIVFTVYDWKEYRRLNSEHNVTFHIGAHNESNARAGRKCILNELRKL